LQRHAFEYFLRETNPNGLVADSSVARSAGGITAVGFALSAYRSASSAAG
jgi:hypothetical protein